MNCFEQVSTFKSYVNVEAVPKCVLTFEYDFNGLKLENLLDYRHALNEIILTCSNLISDINNREYEGTDK